MENIKIGVQIDANTKEATTDAKKYHEQLKQAAETAKSIRVGGGQPASTAAPSYKAAKQPAESKAVSQAQPVGSQAIMEYGSLRGTAEATGASARDFANQAQGLSGLVRLYAIYAANVYALGAAFTALSNAMDTTNMVRGLNQLGAASGVALGALSKELVKATGGAISLREAMQATVKVTAAGLGSENVLRLGTVAAKASQALGVDMTDAVNRLSRGITKLEPELLDELGIFTKIDPAVEKYALSVGKAASQLTDFERRQAFATAVLEEGEKKFAAIQVDANPYNKLAASFQNLIQSGLELVNKVAGPIVNFLSSSPTTLTSIIALLGVNLLGKAIPALSQFKKTLEENATKSNEILQARLAEGQKLRNKASEIAQRNLNINIEKEIEAVAAAEKKIDSLRAEKTSSRVRSKAGIEAIETLKDPFLDPTSEKARKAIDQARIESAKLVAKNAKAAAEKIDELANSVERWGKATTAQKQKQIELDAETTKLQKSLFSVYGINTRLAAWAEKGALRDSIVQTAAYNASVIGLGTSLRILRDEVAKENITGFGKATVLARGYLAAFGGVLQTVASAFSKLFFYVGLIITVYESAKLVFSFFSDNQKQQQAFSDAVDKSSDRMEAFGRTIDEINKKPFAERLGTDSVLAKANAVQELAGSVTDLVKSFQEQDKAASGLDRFFDKIKSFLNYDKASILGENLGKTIFTSLQESAGTPEAEKAKAELSKILDINTNATQKQYSEAIKSIATDTYKLNQVQAVVKNFSNSLSVSASVSKELQTAVEDTDKAYRQFLQGLQSSDALDIFAKKAVDSGLKLLKSLQDPQRAVSDLTNLISDPKASQLFSQEVYANLLQSRQALEAINAEQAKNIALTNSAQKEYDKLAEKLQEAKRASEKTLGGEAAIGSRDRGAPGVKPGQTFAQLSSATPQPSPELKGIVNRSEQQISKLQSQLDEAQILLNRRKAQQAEDLQTSAKISAQFVDSSFDVITRGANIIQSKIELSLSKGVNIVSDNLLSALGDLPGTARIRAENEKRLIALQIEQLKTQESLIRETRLNSLLLAESNRLKEKEELVKQRAELATGQFDGVAVDDTKVQEERKKVESKLQTLERRGQAIRLAQTSVAAPDRAQLQQVRAGLKAEREKGLDADVTALAFYNDQLNYIQQRSAIIGQITEQTQRLLAVEDTKQIGVLKEREAVLQGIYQRSLSIVDSKLEEVALDESRRGYLTEQELQQKNSLELQKLGLQQGKEVSQILSDIAVQEFALVQLEKEKTAAAANRNEERVSELDKAIAEARDEVARRRNALADKAIANETAVAAQEQKTRLTVLDLQKRQIAEARSLQDIELQRINILADTAQQAQEISANFLKSAGVGLSPEFIAQQEASLAVSKQRYEFEKFAAAETLQTRRRIQDLELERARLDTAKDKDRIAAINAQIEAERALSAARISSQQTVNDLKTREIELIEQARLKDAERERQLKFYGDFSQSLQQVFEGLGDSTQKFGEGLSKALETFGQFTTNIEKSRTEISTLEDQRLKAQEAFAAAQKAMMEAGEGDSPARDDAFLAQEKSRKEILGLDSEIDKKRKQQQRDELAGTAKLIGSTKSMFKEKTAAYKVLNAIEKGMHIARLAMDAKELVSKLTTQQLGVAGKITAEMEETAALYGGVAARAPGTITEIFGKITSQLGIAGPVVAAGIVAAIFGAMGGGGKKVPAISAEQRQETQGTAMGFNAAGEKVRVREGVFGDTGAKSESIANSLEILRDNSVVGLDYNDKLLKAFEKLSASIGEAAKAAYGVRGIREGSAFGTIEGTTGGGLFGKKTTTQIIDSGIKIVGMFDQLAAAGGGVIEGFETVQTTTKRTFGRARVRVDTQAFGLDDATTRAINDAFGAASDVIYEVADTLKIDANQVAQTLSTQKVDELVSLRGLTGEALQEQLEAVIGSAVDDASLAVFGSLATAYRKFGEGALETVTRVADTNRKIEQALGNLRGTGIAVDLDFDVTEALADASGGLDKFLDNVDGFTENFLTDAEKLAPVQQSVGRELARLGLSGIKTRDQFKTLVQQLIATGQTGTDTFVSLLKLQDGFDKVAKAAEETTKTLEDALQKAYDTRVSELTKLRDEFTGFAKSLRDYSSSLRTSNLSPLTPKQQYDLLKQEFLTTREAAGRGDTAALQRFQSVSDRFAQASQRMFGGSAEYVADFTMILEATENTATFAELQAQTATNTLEEIKNTVGQLITLNDTAQQVANGVSGLGAELTQAIASLTANRAANLVPPTTATDIPVIGGTVAEQIQANAQARIEEASNQARLAVEKLLQAELELVALRQAEADRLEALNRYDSSVVSGAATGMAFDKGVRKYAQGGVVTSMTGFRYNEGLGVMGEAGPEAIMPLRRAPDGNLGVIAVGNQDMAKQLAELNKQVQQLTEIVAQGSIMNAEATNRNTQEVTQAINQTAESVDYQVKLVNRVKIV